MSRPRRVGGAARDNAPKSAGLFALGLSLLALASPAHGAEPAVPAAPAPAAPAPAAPVGQAAPPVGQAQAPPPAVPPPAVPPPAAAPPAALADATAAPAATPEASGAPAQSAAAPEPPGASGSGLFEQSLSGAEVTPASPDGAGLPRGVELDGYVRADVFVGKVPGFAQGVIKAGYGELAVKLAVKQERYGAAYAEARFRYGLQGDERDLFVELREAYVDAYLGPLDLRLGQQIIVWGRADAFNPTNNLLPFDLRVRSPFEDDRRLGNFGARAFVKLAPLRLEGVWLPIYSAVELPTFVLPDYVSLSEPNFPAPELENGLFGARAHLELPAFEASVSYVNGHAPLPGLVLRSFSVGEEPPEVSITRTAYRQQVLGVDFSTAIGELFALRGEAAYRRPRDSETERHVPRPDLQYVVGVDRSFGALNVIAQYLGRYALDWQREPGPEEPVDPDALAGFMPPLPPFVEQSITDSINDELARRNQILFGQTERVQHLASLRLEWLTLNDTLSLSALSLVNFSTKEWLLFPKLGYRITDAMSTYVGAEIYAGPDETLFGLIDEGLSAGYAELRLSY